jgi:ribonuclease III
MNKPTKKSLKELEAEIGHEYNDHEIFHRSLTHKSFMNENRAKGDVDNERIEFLGDAVLNLLVTLLLMDYFPDLDEGVLSKRRSSIVNERSLAKLARKICLGDSLYLGKGEEFTGGRDKDSILADAFEAIIGGLYIDGGLKAAQTFVNRYFRPLIRYSAKPGSYKDYKTLVQEMAQKLYKQTPQYHLVNVEGPEHNKVFESEIIIGSESFGKGKGRSKKDSEQKCAKTALKRMESGAE